VGSKAFTEGIILGEILWQRLETVGISARHQQQLGGTQVLWNALLSGEIDAYVDYTGTIAAEILGGEVEPEMTALREAVAADGIQISDRLGLANTYALGMRRAHAASLGLNRISDLGRHDLEFGFSNEFMDRSDGWPGVRARYQLNPTSVTGLDHDIAYRALAGGEIDVTDLYTTDAEIRSFDLVVLEDDLRFFPDYRAVVVYRAELTEHPGFDAVLEELAGAIPTETMIGMNAAVRVDGGTERAVAARFLQETFGQTIEAAGDSLPARLLARTREHLAMVAISLLAAILTAIPAGIAAARNARLGALLLGLGGVLQTVPSLALLVFLIPVLGIGAPPAILALFLYSLLPIMRNTANGLLTIPAALLESADALGLPRGARLRIVELPMASPAILAGIKTAAVINVGTATLGALIGAGGYGQPILTGIRLDDTALILEGAVPAAMLALVAQALFGLLERRVVPRGLSL
jgi:osmoprotectant transport system permease protein